MLQSCIRPHDPFISFVIKLFINLAIITIISMYVSRIVCARAPAVNGQNMYDIMGPCYLQGEREKRERNRDKREES